MAMSSASADRYYGRILTDRDRAIVALQTQMVKYLAHKYAFASYGGGFREMAMTENESELDSMVSDLSGEIMGDPSYQSFIDEHWPDNGRHMTIRTFSFIHDELNEMIEAERDKFVLVNPF